ncbi:MAG: LysR family transcriptional regulator substrate-binding protein [Actinobacteria bacterium]|nr:LysR family transcriptional regulator substrate-binding protein [Actinomycetota bacterium]
MASGSEIQLTTTNTDETIQAVRTSRADLGVPVLRTRPKGMRVRELGTYPQVLALPAGHPLARNRVLHLRDLGSASPVVPPTGRPHRSTVDQRFAECASWSRSASRPRAGPRCSTSFHSVSVWPPSTAA